MTDHDMRAQLRQLIADIDAGRVTLPRPSARLPLGSTVLVAALGIGLAGCGGSKPSTTSPQPTATTTLPAPEPGGDAAAPDRPIDDGAQMEYMAPDVEPIPEPVDEPRALYGVDVE